MEKKIVITLFLAFMILAVPGCRDDERCSVHPEAFRFSLIATETGQDLLASGVYNKDEIQLYYFYNEEKQDLIVNSEIDPDRDIIEMVSAQLPMISLTGRSDIFYLRLNQAETDTLFVTVEKEDRGECDHHPYIMVKHNHKILPVIEGKGFVIEK